MDKTDVMYGVAAIIIILIMALVVKPMMTGQPVNTGIPVRTTTAAVQPTPTALVTTSVPTSVATTIIPTPTPVPTWNTSVVQTVGFVNSSTYGISLTQEIPNGTRFDNPPRNLTMVSFAKITGKSSGTTQVFTIPFPYWELVYTVDPVAETKPGTVIAASTKSGAPSSGVQGSYSSAKPEFTIQVMDAQDPSRIVRTITPPGGIDINLWTGVKGSINPASTPKAGRVSNSPDTPVTDPRPWTEKFFEGQKGYYFIIDSHLLNSYTIDIRVRSSDIGKY